MEGSKCPELWQAGQFTRGPSQSVIASASTGLLSLTPSKTGSCSCEKSYLTQIRTRPSARFPGLGVRERKCNAATLACRLSSDKGSSSALIGILAAWKQHQTSRASTAPLFAKAPSLLSTPRTMMLQPTSWTQPLQPQR
jgi:hypothetical protein